DAGAGADIHGRLPDVLCVEMEGAAMAQVCYESGIPYAVMRVISDHADPGAKEHFADFLEHRAGRYTCGVLARLMESRATQLPPLQAHTVTARQVSPPAGPSRDPPSRTWRTQTPAPRCSPPAYSGPGAAQTASSLPAPRPAAVRHGPGLGRA